MNSNFLNNIIDLINNKMKHETLSILNFDQKLYFDKVLEKQAQISISELKNYCNQFTDDAYNQVKVLSLIQKFFIREYFDPFLHKEYDIMHDIIKYL